MKPMVTNFRLLPDGRWHIGVVAKRTASLEDACHLATTLEQSAPAGEETTAWKPATDVVVRGSIYAASPLREQCAHIELGPHVRKIRATGDRVIEHIAGGAPVFSLPSAFERMPMRFERCYGGFDRGAYERLGDPEADEGLRIGAALDSVSKFAYPRNRRGTGFFVAIDPGRLIGASLPSLDDPDDPVTPERLLRASPEDWVAAPRPVALDWVEPFDFPRSAHWGAPPVTFAGHLPELEERIVTEADLASDRPFPPKPSARSMCGTLLGHRGIRLRGGEDIRLDNLHPTWRHIRTNLPSDAPLVRLQPPGCPWFELEPQLDTVVLDLDAKRLSMVWSAKLEVAGKYPDDELAQVVAEVRWP